ncbi:hypothetical protein pb186bvf_008714 [Paramecium bursaria]
MEEKINYGPNCQNKTFKFQFISLVAKFQITILNQIIYNYLRIGYKAN